MHDLLRPLEWRRVWIVDLHEGVYRLPHLPGGGKARAGAGPSRQDTEPDLDLVQPRTVGRDVVEVDVRVPTEPTVVFGLVRIQIVEDDVPLPSVVEIDERIHEVQEVPPAP